MYSQANSIMKLLGATSETVNTIGLLELPEPFQAMSPKEALLSVIVI